MSRECSPKETGKTPLQALARLLARDAARALLSSQENSHGQNVEAGTTPHTGGGRRPSERVRKNRLPADQERQTDSNPVRPNAPGRPQ